ncbi:TIGR00303 family protein [filamentous cyanobacterium CCP5]|nr:TIGR00303 family protein [filamentous cyanobacterium CCP5]
MIKSYGCQGPAAAWISRFQAKRPLFALVLGFTDTGLIPGISAAGKTPSDRRYTALADGEFIYRGPGLAQFPLPPLEAGASPAIISRAIIARQAIPTWIFDAGLRQPLAVPGVHLGGRAAACLTTGQALPLTTVRHLWQQGLAWGDRLSRAARCDYWVIGECVVGGTTTALALLLALGVDAWGLVNSSHTICNHDQKQRVVMAGLAHWQATKSSDPLAAIAAIGDPMQPVVAGMAMAASRHRGVLLAGGTQMLAVYALIRALSHHRNYPWRPEQVAVGTTRWVAEDPSGDTPGLAAKVNAPLIATQLTLADSRHWQLRAYEAGFVKEGVGAGGCAIAAHLYRGWDQARMLRAIDQTFAAHAGHGHQPVNGEGNLEGNLSAGG